MKIAFVATAALLAASAFAQGSVTSSSGASVNSGSGVTVTPGVPSATVEVMPHTSVAVPSQHLLPGGAMVQSSSTTVLGGPSGNAAGTKTEVTTYWANVPADVQRDGNFQRWQQLK
jgi:hypothetical protein